MKKILLIVTLVANVSCVTRIPMTNGEVCSIDDMVTSGTTVNSINPISGHEVHCRPPENEYERCISAIPKITAIPRAEFNDNLNLYRAVTIVGTAALVIPGVFAAVYYNGIRESADRDDSTQVAKLKRCEELKK